MLELGILGKIKDIPDDNMRFYALIGISVSTAAEIEHNLFDCYYSTSGHTKKKAALNFYKKVNFSYKRDLADVAVRARLANLPILRVWDEIIGDIQTACGPDGARNLVSHNPLAAHVYVRRQEDGTPDLIDGSALIVEMGVLQNHNLVMAGKRQPAKQTLESIYAYAYEILGVQLRLFEFCRNHLAIFSEHRE